LKSFAIVVICYNRIDSLKRLIASIEKADYGERNDIELVFSIDFSGNSNIRDYAEVYNWKYGNKRIITYDERQGLKKHVLKCGDLTKEYDIVTVLEDDIYLSNSFYHYAYNVMEFYWDDERIAGISLYGFQKNWLDWILRFEPQKNKYDVYFLKVAQSWGQVWSYNKWSEFKKWYNRNNKNFITDNIPEYLLQWPDTSWLKYHDKYLIEKNKYFVYPYYSLSNNFSDAVQHYGGTINNHQIEF